MSALRDDRDFTATVTGEYLDTLRRAVDVLKVLVRRPVKD
jgi:hypothetical protein